MKIELQCGDTITIPKGCKAIVKDGSVVFEKEEEKKEQTEQEFKDGDVLHSKTDDTMLLFKEVCNHDREVFDSHYNTSHRDDKRWNINALRHATEEEKQQLFDALKENDYQWNAKEKQVEKIRWRAEEGEIYYYVSNEMNVSSTRCPNKGEYLYDYEGSSFLSYNYFRTIEQAEEAAKRVKETLRKYHKEIGE